jgi:NAD(P)-dependent dehydrogenase (short-subunit alcohol dehydrogenase family)
VDIRRSANWPTPSGEVTGDLIDRAFAVNVRAVMLLSGIVAPSMAARGGGAIVNMGWINGIVGMAGSAVYSATKATVHSLTKSWAAEFGPSGVRVNTVAPGPTLTDTVMAMEAYLAPMISGFPSRRASTLAGAPTRPARGGVTPPLRVTGDNLRI